MSRERTRAACLEASIAAIRERVARFETAAAKRHLASLSPERRAELEKEWTR